MGFNILSNIYLVNKYIELLPIKWISLLNEQNLYIITGNNQGISLGLLSVLDFKINKLFDQKQIIIEILILNTNIVFLEFINYLFKNNIELVQLKKNQYNEEIINYVQDQKLIYFSSNNYVFIYSPIFYVLINPLKMELSFENKLICFNIEVRKHGDIYYLYPDCTPFVVKNNTPIRTIKCNLYLITNQKTLIYNNKLSIFVTFLEKDHYVLFMKPVKLFTKTIKEAPYITLFNTIIKNDIIWKESIKKNLIIYTNKSFEENQIIDKKYGYLYIIHIREHIRFNENIYKIGCTKDITQRLRQYPKGSKLLFTTIAYNFRNVEILWINQLKQK
jgi:T5orf172 domain